MTEISIVEAQKQTQRNLRIVAVGTCQSVGALMRITLELVLTDVDYPFPPCRLATFLLLVCDA